MRKKILFILLLVTMLALGVWTASPAKFAAAQPAQYQTADCEDASTMLVGGVAELPRAQSLIRDICDFRVRVDEIPSNVSEFDLLFIESAIAGNMLEIQSLEIALENTTNEEWRGLINAMIIMHTSDLEMALSVAEKIGADTEPNLSSAMVYPETPAYDLGKRRIDLVDRFLEPLMNAAGPGGTPTVVPTDGTVVPTETGTITATGVPTDMSTVTVTSSPNASTFNFVHLLQTDVPTDTATVTATALPTDTATETATALPTHTATETATPVPTNTATVTATDLPTETATTIPTETATGSPTVVPTDVTPGPGAGTDFDLLAMEIIEDEHAMAIETALVAQRLVRNDEVRAFARHAADVAHLHKMLMDDLKYRLAHGITLPPPRFHEEYESPRRFEPR